MGGLGEGRPDAESGAAGMRDRAQAGIGGLGQGGGCEENESRQESKKAVHGHSILADQWIKQDQGRNGRICD